MRIIKLNILYKLAITCSFAVILMLPHAIAKPINLNKIGVSSILFPVDDDISNWKLDFGSPFHFGDDIYSDDWNSKPGVIFNDNDPDGCDRDLGAPLVAPISGKIIFNGEVDDYGKQIIIRSTIDNSFAVRLAHMDAITISKVHVDAGENIGTLGNSGTTCAHLHLVLYRNLDTSSMAIENLEAGLPPLRITGAATTFAAPFTVDAEIKMGVVIEPIVSMLLFEKAKPTHPLNDTGITKCGDFANGTSGIYSKDLDCNLSADSEGDPIPPGQDALFGRDKAHNNNLDGNAGFSFTKKDINGATLSSTASNWSCIKDNVTGLMWEIKTTNAGLRDKDWNYTWYNNDSTVNGGNPGVENGGNCFDSVNCDTKKYVAQINASNLCGYSDWRVPEREELRSIIDYGSQLTGARIDSSWFPNLGNSGDYWTNSTFSLLPDSAWLIRIEAGSDLYLKKNQARRVVLTRGGKKAQASPVAAIGNNQTCNSSITASTPLEQFVIHQNGTVTDKRTGLMWKKCREGKNGLMCEDGNELIPGWKSALDHADVHTFAGYSDWRLPNIKELAFLTEFSCSFPGLNRNVFPNISSGTTWSSSQCFASENCAHTVSFDVGTDNTNGKTSTRAIHLVRDPN